MDVDNSPGTANEIDPAESDEDIVSFVKVQSLI